MLRAIKRRRCREQRRANAAERRKVGRVLGGTLAAAAGVLGALPSTPAGADTISDMNIAGVHNPGDNMQGNEWKVYPIIRRGQVAGFPAVMTLNEACSNQVSRGWIELSNNTGGTFSPGFYEATTSGSCPGDHKFGNAAFAQFSGYTPQTPTAAPYAQTAGGEQKGWVCVQGGISRPKYYACSTHFFPRNYDPAGEPGVQFKWAQWINLLNDRRWYAPDHKVYGGGDFYVTFADMAAWSPTFLQSYKEVSRCVSGTNEPKSLWPFTRRVDHIFFSNNSGCTSDGNYWELSGAPNCYTSLAAYEHWNCNRSDHRMVWGNPNVGT